jgi:hypothetical protein
VTPSPAARAREGFLASLALVPSVVVYGSVFGGLAVLPALAAPMAVAPGGRLALGPAQPELWGALVVLVVAARRLNLLVAVGVSVGVVALVRAVWC